MSSRLICASWGETTISQQWQVECHSPPRRHCLGEIPPWRRTVHAVALRGRAHATMRDNFLSATRSVRALIFVILWLHNTKVYVARETVWSYCFLLALHGCKVGQCMGQVRAQLLFYGRDTASQACV
jgi:hypothetical protein